MEFQKIEENEALSFLHAKILCKPQFSPLRNDRVLFFARASTHINGHKGGDPKIGRRPESRFAHEIDDNFTETMPANN